MGKISLRERIGYGFGDMASSMFWKLFGIYLLFFYTDVMGLPAATVGTLFLITRIWDTLLDPVIGMIADRTTSKWGKFRPYLLYLAVPFGIMGLITFSVPGPGSSISLLLYIYITYSLMMLVYSFINVPYAALLGVISDDPKERNILASFRMGFAFAGSFIALALIEPLISFKGGSTRMAMPENATAWQWAVGVIACLCVLLFFLCFAWVKERVQPVRQQSASLKTDLRDLIRNKPWYILVAAGMAVLIFNSIRDGAAMYYFRYYIQKNEAVQLGTIAINFSTLYLVVGQVANLIGVMLAFPLANRIGKKACFSLAMGIASVLSVLFYWLGQGDIELIFVLQLLISCCAGTVFPLLWSMYADIADYSEWKTGRRATGLIFSSSSMSQKMGWTFGSALTAWLLAAFGFQANQVQGELAQTGIRLMLSWLPAVGAVIALVMIYFYPLTDAQMNKIGKTLKERRSSVEDEKSGIQKTANES
jgi:GPH family glycoside/pentoside/hexuronide:cation symporter